MSASLSEAVVIGACMDDAKAYWQIADILTPDDFHHRGYAAVFAEIRDRALSGRQVDMFVIADERPDLREILAGEPMSHAWRHGNLKAYAEVVQKAAVTRRIRKAGSLIAHLDGDDVMGEAQRLIGACSARVDGGMRHISDFGRMSFHALEERMKATGDLTGVPTGLPELDDLTGGLQPCDLIIVAATPSVGKTAFALQVTRTAAAHAKKEATGKHVGIFSLEMSGTQLNDRMVSSAGQFDGKLLRTPKRMDESDWARWTEGTTIITGLPILIDDHSGITIDVLCARVRQCHAATPFSIIVIDYLQLITPPKAATHALAIGEITRTLKNLAKELGIPIMLLSQLNREAAGVRPLMKHLRDSGSIESDADVVIFLWRPDDAVRDYIEMLLAKQRNGDVADLALEFNGRHQTFHMAKATPPSVKGSRARTADAMWDEADGVAFG